MRLYRITKPQFAEPFSGEGARLHGGRWNPKGVALVYYAGTESLAMLETRVHVPAAALLVRWTMMVVEVPDDLIAPLDAAQLPASWNAASTSPEVQEVGRAWVAAGSSLALRVPSVVSGSDVNVLLNPQHSDISKAVLLEKREFAFDRRLAQ